MPSPGEDIQSWSTVAANNGAADPLINWAEGQTRASVNNSSRSEMAAHAKNRNLLNGSIVTTGSTNAQAFFSGVTYTTIPTGLLVKLKVGSGLTNTTSMTLNMDGLGGILVKTANGDNLRGGEFVANGYVDLLFNGTNWIFLYGQEFFQELISSGGGLIIGKQVFSTAGTSIYTPTLGTECVIIECLGAGGGGAGTPNTGSNNGNGAGGGGAGSYSRSFKSAAEIGASQIVIVGAKGAGGAIGGAAGQNGGDTSVGALCIAKGGGAAAGNGGLNSNGGPGGVAGTGDIAGTGEGGEPGLAHVQVLSGMSGRGGDTAFGSGGAGINTVTAQHGNAATGYGAGGGGGASYGGTSATMGGDGAGGLVIILELAGRGAPGRDGADGPQGPIGPTGPTGPGTGDVLRSGTPSAGQLAQWVDASHIKGIDFVGFTTGDAKLTLKTVADPGWTLMQEHTIGDVSSGANENGPMFQALFALLYTNITDAWAPIFTSTGAATTRAAQGSAAAAWAAQCRLKLTRQLGRSLTIANPGSGAGLASSTLGSFDGAETHAISLAELPAHSHPPSTANSFVTVPSATENFLRSDGDVPMHVPQNMEAATGSAGSGVAMTLIPPRAFWNIMLKL